MDSQLRRDRYAQIYHCLANQSALDDTEDIMLAALDSMYKKNPEGYARLMDHTVRLTDCHPENLSTYIQAQASRLDRGSAWFLYEELRGTFRDLASFSQTAINRTLSRFLRFDDRYDIEDDINNLGFVHCESCEDWEHEDRVRETNNYESVCRSCISNNYTYLDLYDRYIHNDDVVDAIDEWGDEIQIDREDSDYSWDDDRETYVHRNFEPPIIGSYHSHKGQYEPVHSTWTKLNKRWYGIELEVEVKDGDRQEIARRINSEVNDDDVGSRCYFENDGSLSNGFEIITQPMGLDLHETFWGWLHTDLTKGLLSHKTSTCGLHIHVTRRSLSKLQLAKMVTFLNHPDNARLVHAVSRRYSPSYARIVEKKLGSAYKLSSRGDTRYEAINLEPRDTIEFRIFKGSLKYEAVMAALEFVNALINFCHEQSGYGFDLSPESFMEFIALPEQAKETSVLRAYLDQRFERLKQRGLYKTVATIEE